MSQNKETGFTYFEHPLGDERKYVKAMAARFPGTIEFETGCGHIAHDLMARLPSVPEMDHHKTLFCRSVAEAVSPLAACLFAKSMCIRISASSSPISPPEVIAGLGTYSVFDVPNNVMRHCMLPPPDRPSYDGAFLIASGLTVLCEPLELASQQFHDSTRDQVHTSTDAIWQWTERMIHEMYEQKGKTFVPERLRAHTSALNGQMLLGVVDGAAMQVVGMGVAVGAGLVQARADATPHHITSAFIHEASFEETAAHPKTKGAAAKPAAEPAPKDAHGHNPNHGHNPGRPDVS